MPKPAPDLVVSAKADGWKVLAALVVSVFIALLGAFTGVKPKRFGLRSISVMGIFRQLPVAIGVCRFRRSVESLV